MLYLGDCFEILPSINKKIDLVLVDLPYGQTINKWDICIDLKKMWIDLKKICSENCNYVFTTTTKYGIQLINSNPNWFRYDLVWEKSRSAGFLSCNEAPLRTHEMIYIFGNMDTKYLEDINIREYFKSLMEYINRPQKEIKQLFGQSDINHCWRFSSIQFALPTEKNYNQLIQEYKINQMEGFIPYIELKRSYKDIREKEKKPEKIYNPQMTEGKPYKIKEGKILTSNYGIKKRIETTNIGTRYPTSILKFQNENKTIHSTQKPADLLVYLIKTYSNENNTVLDFTMGSGSAGVACKLTNRQFIGIEKDPDIYFSAVNRLW